MKIKEIAARPILSSQGNDTIEGILTFDNGLISKAAVPAGISAGAKEIKKVPVDVALTQINEVNKLCRGKEFTQRALDDEISGHNFGGNVTLAVSAAFWRAEHTEISVATFPQLMVLLFEGGKHGSNPRIAIQEFMAVIPTIDEGRKTYKTIEQHLSRRGISINVGREGGFSPPDFDDEKILETIEAVLPEAKIALDVAASHEGKRIDYQELMEKYKKIFSLEDPFPEDKWEDWIKFMSRNSSRVKVIADDLTTSNPRYIAEAITRRAANGVIIKPDQIGTISATVDAVAEARKGGFSVVFSHRGDETNDHWMTDLAVILGADFVKFGGFARGERIAKYNRLMELGMK